jgi:CHAT domain-containing protein
VLLPGGQATASAIAASLQDAGFFHFSGHAYSDHGDPDRSALLVAPAPDNAPDPFPAWVAAAKWRPASGGWRTAEIPGTGRLSERGNPETQEVERRMERGSAPTLYARYSGGRLRRLGELWSVGDILALGQRSECRFAFLSACESGVAGGKSSYVDEYGGLPAALRLGGIDSLVCSLWEVDEGFTALYADLFYEQLPAGRADPVAVVRQAGQWLREARKQEVLQRLDHLADQVRKRSPRAAMALEAYRAKIDRERGDVPYATAWEWASFYAIGGGTIDLEGINHREDALNLREDAEDA